jgi:Flp pilus assembly protein TadG
MRFTDNSTSLSTRIASASGKRQRRGVVAVEAAVIMSFVFLLMWGVWEVGQAIRLSCILDDAAREGARLAAGGVNNTGGNNLTPVQVSDVQTAVQNYLIAAGIPSANATAAQVTVTNTSSDTWTNPGSAKPNDPFTVQVTLSGTAMTSLCLVASNITGISQLSATVHWQSNNDTQVTVSTQLPY